MTDETNQPKQVRLPCPKDLCQGFMRICGEIDELNPTITLQCNECAYAVKQAVTLPPENLTAADVVEPKPLTMAELLQVKMEAARAAANATLPWATSTPPWNCMASLMSMAKGCSIKPLTRPGSGATQPRNCVWQPTSGNCPKGRTSLKPLACGRT